jgi:hypothetical protein
VDFSDGRQKMGLGDWPLSHWFLLTPVSISAAAGGGDGDIWSYRTGVLGRPSEMLLWDGVRMTGISTG